MCLEKSYLFGNIITKFNIIVHIHINMSSLQQYLLLHKGKTTVEETGKRNTLKVLNLRNKTACNNSSGPYAFESPTTYYLV